MVLLTSSGIFDFVQVGERFVDGLHVLLDDVFTLPAVRVANRLADRFDGFVARQNLRDREEADLHDGVHARSHAGVTRDLVGVDDVELRFLRDQLLLHLPRQVSPRLHRFRRDC